MYNNEYSSACQLNIKCHFTQNVHLKKQHLITLHRKYESECACLKRPRLTYQACFIQML